MKDVTAKNASRAKLVGIGFGVSTNRFAFGWDARKVPDACGLALAESDGCANELQKLFGVRTGKPLMEWATMSVC